MICARLSVVPSQIHSMSAASGALAQLVSSEVSREPRRGKDWNKATSPMLMPATPLRKKRGKQPRYERAPRKLVGVRAGTGEAAKSETFRVTTW